MQNRGGRPRLHRRLSLGVEEFTPVASRSRSRRASPASSPRTA
jgi:hypothetical protein